MTDTPTLIAEAMQKLADVIQNDGYQWMAAAIRESFPIPFVDDGPNGLGGGISPDNASTIPVREDKKERADKNGRLLNGYFLMCLVSDSVCRQECVPGECKRGSANQITKLALATPSAPLAERLNATIALCDEQAIGCSNIGKPRSDNEWGRIAQLLEDSCAEIARLARSEREARASADSHLKAVKAFVIKNGLLQEANSRLAKALKDIKGELLDEQPHQIRDTRGNCLRITIAALSSLKGVGDERCENGPQ